MYHRRDRHIMIWFAAWWAILCIIIGVFALIISHRGIPNALALDREKTVLLEMEPVTAAEAPLEMEPISE